MAEEEKKVKSKKNTETYQQQLNAIDASILQLQQKKVELAKLVLAEAEAVKEIPLHQLNAIAKYGYDEAKKRLGKTFVS